MLNPDPRTLFDEELIRRYQEEAGKGDPDDPYTTALADEIERRGLDL